MENSKFQENWDVSMNGNLAGQFFHTFIDSKISWQGVVLKRVERGVYLVQLFEWLDGAPNLSKLVKISDMSDWNFYDDADSMNVYYKNHQR